MLRQRNPLKRLGGRGLWLGLTVLAVAAIPHSSIRILRF